MTWDCCETTTPVARKKYLCDACDSVINYIGMDEREFTPDEWVSLKKAEADGFKILPGMKYVKCKGIYDGEPTTFRARLEIDQICREYDLYDV